MHYGVQEGDLLHSLAADASVGRVGIGIGVGIGAGVVGISIGIDMRRCRMLGGLIVPG